MSSGEVRWMLRQAQHDIISVYLYSSVVLRFSSGLSDIYCLTLAKIAGQGEPGPVGGMRIKPLDQKLGFSQAFGLVVLNVVAVKMLD